MPFRRGEIINNQIYHVIHRRIGDELMFKDINDYYRGIFSIYEFNNANPVNIGNRRKIRLIEKRQEKITGKQVKDTRDRLVSVVCFCLMPNHIHLVLRQLKDGGITEFMKKFGTGYASYFYEKYGLKGKGYFFQGRFKSVLIKDERQLKTIFVYSHANPISLVEPGWKKKGVKDVKKTTKFLESYKWSSYLDYIGKKNFQSIIKEEKENILKVMGGEKGCKDFMKNWITYKSNFTDFIDTKTYLE